jgi:hypothetical protein
MKRTGVIKVFLCIANQWATGRQPRENVKEYIELAEKSGLEYGKDFCFTSEYSTLQDETVEAIKASTTMGMLSHRCSNFYKFPKGDMELEKAKEEVLLHHQPHKLGIHRRMLRELQLIGNLLIYPTLEESFGLIGPETAFSGALVVGNRSLSMMYEILGHMTPSFDFGSHHTNHEPAKQDPYLQAVAHAILQRLQIAESVATKAHCRIKYNMDLLYNKYYLPNLM